MTTRAIAWYRCPGCAQECAHPGVAAPLHLSDGSVLHAPLGVPPVTICHACYAWIDEYLSHRLRPYTTRGVEVGGRVEIGGSHWLTGWWHARPLPTTINP